MRCWQALHRQRKYQRSFVMDETGVRMEDLPNMTMEKRGAKSVPLRTSGKEKTMWLWSKIELTKLWVK